MLKEKTLLRFGKILVGSLLFVGLAAPAFAGSVWTWRTDDGSFAFTDDSKRIPAKHRAEAKRKSMGKLTRYERYTKVSADVDEPYADRVRARQAELRGRTAPAPQDAVVVAARAGDAGLAYGVSVSGGRGRDGTNFLVPVAAGQGASDDEPMTIEKIRVKPRNSLASRHWTVIKKGDRIVTVIKDTLHERSLDGPSESDFDL